MSRRTERVAEQLREELARVLREDVTDPRVGLVTLTRVDVAPDLTQALVFWSSMTTTAGEESTQEIAEGLESAASFVRHRLAQVLPLRRVPELRFRFDPSLSLGTNTLKVLSELRDEEKA
ncbi:30S ribosome-binding factor RbfA [Myxococcota bacterium]|nr:30S ribosome-binding factor RbfA [Myxococcota bacterium]